MKIPTVQLVETRWPSLSTHPDKMLLCTEAYTFSEISSTASISVTIMYLRSSRLVRVLVNDLRCTDSANLAIGGGWRRSGNGGEASSFSSRRSSFLESFDNCARQCRTRFVTLRSRGRCRSVHLKLRFWLLSGGYDSGSWYNADCSGRNTGQGRWR